MENAAKFLEAIAEKYSVMSRNELLEFPDFSVVNNPKSPKGLHVTLWLCPMINGTVLVRVEGGIQSLLGLRWKVVVSAFEKTPEGELTRYPQRAFSESFIDRRRRIKRAMQN